MNFFKTTKIRSTIHFDWLSRRINNSNWKSPETQTNSVAPKIEYFSGNVNLKATIPVVFGLFGKVLKAVGRTTSDSGGVTNEKSAWSEHHQLQNHKEEADFF